MTERLEPRQIKMAKSQWDFLRKLGRDLGYHDSRGDHSRLVREIISAAETKWQESPYICLTSRHLVLITRNGDIFYRQIQDIQLNKKRERLPFGVQIKSEKRTDYRRGCPAGQDEATWFRSRWLLNYFEVAHGWGTSQAEILESHVDHEGTDAKMADLLVDRGANSKLVRESVVALEDFVLWRGDKRGDDRVGIPVDIPTRDLEIVVVVDADLYRESPMSFDEIPKLALEFRNPESAKFEMETHNRWNPVSDPLEGRCIKEDPNSQVEELTKALNELKSRVESLIEAQATNGRVVSPEVKPRLKNSLIIPESFLYYKLSWPFPQFAIEVCVRWDRPFKVSRS